MDLNGEIERVAYELFERDGRQHGKDREHWIEAERIVRARHAAKEAGKAPKQEIDPPPKKEASPKAGTSKKSASSPAAGKAKRSAK